jgi:hypothetical protein
VAKSGGSHNIGRAGGMSRVKFPDSLFQLGAFADLRELFACCGELVCLFGRTGNLRAAHWKGFAN